MNDKIYAGIGSRETPRDVLATMLLAASQLASMGWKLRTGGAHGADSAFADGTLNREVHIPWAGYNGINTLSKDGFVVPDFTDEIMQIAADHHPAWDRLTQGTRKLMCRNVTIILGKYLTDPAKMVICWTPKGELVGGTAHGIKIAHTYGIPVFNLAIEADYKRLEEFVYAAQN